MTRLNHLALNKCHLNFSTAGTSGTRKKNEVKIPSAIRDSMVLWYDLAKQGATNESMAENPVLRDLSGNGHDATCYNFAWSGMSGVGGYGLSFSRYSNIHQDRAVIEFDGDYITIIKSVVLDSWQLYNKVSNQFTVPAQRIKVTNLPQNVSFKYCYRNATGKTIILVSITKDGIYDIPSFTVPSGQIYGCEIKHVIDECNITIEQLPLYPNALVSDGVDDYALVTGLPILTKERGYTVIAKRKLFNIANGALVSKSKGLSNANGAFQLERDNGNTGNVNSSVSWGNFITINVDNDETIVYQTSKSYDGKFIFNNYFDISDNDLMYIFCHDGNVQKYYASAAIYSLLLFNRDLTLDEIEWVKTNLIEQ